MNRPRLFFASVLTSTSKDSWTLLPHRIHPLPLLQAWYVPLHRPATRWHSSFRMASASEERPFAHTSVSIPEGRHPHKSLLPTLQVPPSGICLLNQDLVKSFVWLPIAGQTCASTELLGHRKQSSWSSSEMSMPFLASLRYSAWCIFQRDKQE